MSLVVLIMPQIASFPETMIEGMPRAGGILRQVNQQTIAVAGTGVEDTAQARTTDGVGLENAIPTTTLEEIPTGEATSTSGLEAVILEVGMLKQTGVITGMTIMVEKKEVSMFGTKMKQITIKEKCLGERIAFMDPEKDPFTLGIQTLIVGVVI